MNNKAEYATFVFKRDSNIYKQLMDSITIYFQDGSLGSITADDLSEKCDKLEQRIKQLEQENGK